MSRPSRSSPAAAILPAALLLTLGLLTTTLISWCLAAVLPHNHLLRRHNLVSQPGPPGPTGKPAPRYITIHQYSRRGMIRLSWKPGLLSPTDLNLDLRPRSTLALNLPTVNQDRSWGTLPRILNSPDYTQVNAGGQDARGWPFLALWCTIDEAAPSGHSVRGGIPLSARGISTGHARALPCLPIWKGFILNTAIYTAAWLFLILLLRVLRAHIRRRRGRCPRCNYHLPISTHCPECGWRWNTPIAPHPPCSPSALQPPPTSPSSLHP